MNLLAQLQKALAHKNPLYIKVKVIPKSPKTEIVEVMADGAYKIRVAAPAEGGKANQELIRFLKKTLGASEVVIVSGKTERAKLMRIAAKRTPLIQGTARFF